MSSQVIDFHTHVQPTVAEGIAFQEGYGFTDPPRNGTPSELIPLMDEAGVSRTLMVPWMPARDVLQQRIAQREGSVDEAIREALRREVVGEWFALNRWATELVAEQPDRLCCLVGIDPLLMSESELREEVRDQLARGACGIKIAPLFIGATPDDPRVAITFELASEHGVFVLSQAGADGYRGDPAWGHPRHFEAVLAAWPDVDVQLAHLGLGAEEEVARLTGRYANLFADTSARLQAVGQPGEWSLEEAAECFRRIGTDRVIFGTNYPMHDPRQFVEVIRAMPLREDEREQILHLNAARMLERGGR